MNLADKTDFNKPALGLIVAPFAAVVSRNVYLITIICLRVFIDLEYPLAGNGK